MFFFFLSTMSALFGKVVPPSPEAIQSEKTQSSQKKDNPLKRKLTDTTNDESTANNESRQKPKKRRKTIKEKMADWTTPLEFAGATIGLGVGIGEGVNLLTPQDGDIEADINDSPSKEEELPPPG